MSRPPSCLTVICLLISLLLCSFQSLAASASDCPSGTILAIIAHPDDDLLFMNPDQSNAIAQGFCVWTVYLTSGDRGSGLPYSLARERGLKAAYAHMASVANHWATNGWDLAGATVVHHVLQAQPRVHLLMLRIPDPWLGAGWGSLTPLSRLESTPNAQVRTEAPYRQAFSRASLVAWLARLIQAVQPKVIRLMDASITIPYQKLCWRCHGHDHPDHIASARLVLAAMQLAPGAYHSQAYLGYPSQELPANLSQSEKALKTVTFLRYMANDWRYCPAQTHCGRPHGPEAAWVWRQYRLPPLEGVPHGYTKGGGDSASR